MSSDKGIDLVSLRCEDIRVFIMVTVTTSCPNVRLCNAHTALSMVMQMTSRLGVVTSLPQAQETWVPRGAMDPVQTMEANLCRSATLKSTRSQREDPCFTTTLFWSLASSPDP